MGFAARTRFDWQLRSRVLRLGECTSVMGIVNVTPDSFSDGGAFASTQAAVDHALRLLDAGADVVDIGGESTRPGSSAGTQDALSAEAERRRVVPVIAAVLRARPSAVVSVDTYRAATARAAVEAGAEIVNDVSGGLWDADMFAACAAMRCGLVVMHTRGLPGAWASQVPLSADEVVPLVMRELRTRVDAAMQAGVAREQMAVDPGFGFGKRGAENWALLADVARLRELAMPMVIGLSRKGFLNASVEAADRDEETHVADTAAILQGAHVVRVHDVAGAVRAAAAADALLPS